MNRSARLSRLALALQLAAIGLMTVGLVIVTVLADGDASINDGIAKTVVLGCGFGLAGAGIVVSRRSDRGTPFGQRALTVLGAVCLTFLAAFVLWRRVSWNDSSSADIGSGFVLLLGLATLVGAALAHWLTARRSEH